MLPYWHGASIEFCARPSAQHQHHQHQHQQKQQRLTSMPSSAVVAPAWQSVSDSLTNNSDFADDATCPGEAAAAAAAAGWSWLDEDRLHSATRASSMTDEQRELDSRAAAAEEQLLAHRIARIAAFDDLDLCSLTNWCDKTHSLGKPPVNASNKACGQDFCYCNRDYQDSWFVEHCVDDNDKVEDSPAPSPSLSQRHKHRQKRRSQQTPPSPPHQANNSNRAAAAAAAAAVAVAAAAVQKAAISGGSNSAGGGQAVASGRSLADIEASVELTRNNSNQQQRYEMRGGHTVEICSRVEFPDRATRDVTVTVEATHSNGCHRVIMFKGLTAKKRPDLGPKVKDCRLRMDQIVMTRASTSSGDWQKSITMSYDSDFQVGLGEDKNRPL